MNTKRNIKTIIQKDFWNMLLWFAVGYCGVKLGQWLIPSLPASTVTAFFLGGFTAFIVLSVYGQFLQMKQETLKQEAMNQFIKDQKADQEKQAKIDKEIIEQLKHEHSLSGEEQDRRLRALEAALKHLRGK